MNFLTRLPCVVRGPPFSGVLCATRNGSLGLGVPLSASAQDITLMLVRMDYNTLSSRSASGQTCSRFFVLVKYLRTRFCLPTLLLGSCTASQVQHVAPVATLAAQDAYVVRQSEVVCPRKFCCSVCPSSRVVFPSCRMHSCLQCFRG